MHKLLILAAGLVLTCVVLIAGVTLTRVGNSTVKSMSNAITTRNASIDEAQYTQYTNGFSTGSDVVSAIRKYKDSLSVKVLIYKTASTTAEIDNDDFGTTFQNLPTNANYINPAAQFSCELIRSASDVVVGLAFKQQKYVSLATPTASISLPYSMTPVAYATNASSIDESSDEVSTASDSYSSDDLEIVYSDGGSKEQNTTKAVAIENIANAIYDYSSQLDDILKMVDSLDLEDGDDSLLLNALDGLGVLYTNLEAVKGQCTATAVGKDNVEGLIEDVTEVQLSVSKAEEEVKVLQKRMKEKKDSQTVWYVGYPVKEEVKVSLEDGVLEFSGEGDADTGHELPKWLSKAKEIKKVVFQDGVIPVNVDYWFSGCANLKKVVGFPESVESANGTFSQCGNLKSVVLGSKMKNANGIADGVSIKFKVSDRSVTQETLNELSELPDSGIDVEVRK